MTLILLCAVLFRWYIHIYNFMNSRSWHCVRHFTYAAAPNTWLHSLCKWGFYEMKFAHGTSIHPKKYAHGFVYGLITVWIMLYFLVESSESFIYSSRLLRGHWGNRMIAPVPMTQPWRVWVKSTSSSPQKTRILWMGCVTQCKRPSMRYISINVACGRWLYELLTALTLHNDNIRKIDTGYIIFQCFIIISMGGSSRYGFHAGVLSCALRPRLGRWPMALKRGHTSMLRTFTLQWPFPGADNAHLPPDLSAITSRCQSPARPRLRSCIWKYMHIHEYVVQTRVQPNNMPDRVLTATSLVASLLSGYTAWYQTCGYIPSAAHV